MDDDALRERLRAIERRQYVIIALLVVPYLVGAGELFGSWPTSVSMSALAIGGFTLLVVRRRRRRNPEHQ